MERERMDKPCITCGKIMRDVTKAKKYCTECLAERAYYQNKERYGDVRALKRSERVEKQAPRKSTIDEIMKRAMEKGLSYGKFVALYGSGV